MIKKDNLNILLTKFIFFKKLDIKFKCFFKNLSINNKIKNNIISPNFLENYLFKHFFFKPNEFIMVIFKKKIFNLFFIKFHLFYNFYKNKKISFNRNYKSFFLKNVAQFSASLYNFYSKNKLFFYKKYSNIFYKKKPNFSKKYNAKKKVFFLKLKKKKDLINPNFFLDFSKFSKSLKFFKKPQSYFLFSTIFLLNENIIFNDKKTNVKSKNKQHILKTLNIISNNFKKNTNLIFFEKNQVLLKFFSKKYKNKFVRNNQFTDNLDLFFLKSDYTFKKNLNFNINPFKLGLDFILYYKKHNLHTFIKNLSVNLIFILNTKEISFFKSKFKNKKIKKNPKIFKKFVYNKNKLTGFNKYILNVFKNIIYLNELFDNNSFFKKNLINLVSNKFILKNLKIMSDQYLPINVVNSSNNISHNYKLNYYNNFYPIFYTNKTTYNRFFLKFKFNLNISYLSYMQFYIIGFLENFFKKKFYLKSTNNYFNKPSNLNYLYSIHDDYKNFQPKYMKNFLIRDFLEIVWYSFFLRDLTLLSDWISKFMELTSFKVHKRFLLFFQNFITKYSTIFIDIMKISGFFFDIRGKVGVTGNSKKRHFFFKIGKLNKSTKMKKINFKQTVVRTPSGALGLTFILNFN